MKIIKQYRPLNKDYKKLIFVSFIILKMVFAIQTWFKEADYG